MSLANPELQVFRAMLDGWRNQQMSRALSEQTIKNGVATVTRFRDFVDAPPWRWTFADVDEFSANLVTRGRALSTLRQVQGSIRGFCDYLTSPLYDWMLICEREFGEVPSQVCLPWNTVAHRYEFEGNGKRRPFTYEELERLFDTADARVESLVTARRKGALGALRDAQLLKTVYAFGLRRTEAVMLDIADLHHNAKVRKWGRYGAIHVRWGKAAGGGAPRRRTVLLVPEFDWWIEGMQMWLEQARDRFAPRPELDALWVTERRTRLSAGYLDRRFAELRTEAGLPRELTLHSLRHSYVTHLLEFGYADRFVQDQVGHKHSSTTSIYASVSSDYKNRQLAQALKNLIEGEADDD